MYSRATVRLSDLAGLPSRRVDAAFQGRKAALQGDQSGRSCGLSTCYKAADRVGLCHSLGRGSPSRRPTGSAFVMAGSACRRLCHNRVGLCHNRVGICHNRVGICHNRVGLCPSRGRSAESTGGSMRPSKAALQGGQPCKPARPRPRRHCRNLRVGGMVCRTPALSLRSSPRRVVSAPPRAVPVSARVEDAQSQSLLEQSQSPLESKARSLSPQPAHCCIRHRRHGVPHSPALRPGRPSSPA
jgi:hypothetical protein